MAPIAVVDDVDSIMKNEQSISNDEISVKRKRAWSIIGYALLCVLVTGALVCLCLFDSLVSPPFTQYIDNPCAWTTHHTSVWSITNMTGNYSLVRVRVIDTLVNVILGRGGQLVLAWISYRIFGASMQRMAGSNDVPLDAYTRFTLFRIDIRHVWPTVKATWQTRGARSKANFLFMLYTVILVVVWGPLVDFAFGYVPEQTTMLQLDNGYLVPWRPQDFPFSAGNGPAVDYCNQTMTLDNVYTSSDGLKFPPLVCMPGQTYMWGFSWTTVTIAAALLLGWTWGVFGVWVDALKNSSFEDRRSAQGRYSAIVELGQAISSTQTSTMDGAKGRLSAAAVKLAPCEKDRLVVKVEEYNL